MAAYVFFMLMCISVISLLYYGYKKEEKAKVITKTLASLCFVGIAIGGQLSGGGNRTYFTGILLGLIFSLVGDVFLAYVYKKDETLSPMFMGGVISFALAHIVYALTFLKIMPLSLKDIALTMIFFSLSLMIFNGVKGFNFKGMFAWVVGYSLVISFMVAKAISLATVVGLEKIQKELVIIGAVLFVLSDCILVCVYFHKKCPKKMTAVNLIVYYLAQGLIALSILYQ